jgi:K(+)-stimulated pyrophosphate-energized sodium pump
VSAQTADAVVCGTPWVWWIAPTGAVLALAMAYAFYSMMIKADAGNARMVEIAGYVREGAMAYLRQQYSRVGMVFAILVAVFGVLAAMGVQNPFVPVAFLTGGFFSGLCGYLGMNTATRASSRTAQGASESLNRGLQVAFRSGAVMGLVVVGFGLSKFIGHGYSTLVIRRQMKNGFGLTRLVCGTRNGPSKLVK